MTPEAITAIITAATAFVAALGTMLGVLLPKLRKAEHERAATDVKVSEVHTIVNQQRTDAQNYQVALTKALQDAGIAVPADQSLGASKPPTENV